MANNTEIIEVMSKIERYPSVGFDGFYQVKAVINQDGITKETTFITENKKSLRKIKVGFKYQGDYWND